MPQGGISPFGVQMNDTNYKDTDAINAMNPTQQQYLVNAVHNNPGLLKDPKSMQALGQWASGSGLSLQQVSGAVNWLNANGDFINHAGPGGNKRITWYDQNGGPTLGSMYRSVVTNVPKLASSIWHGITGAAKGLYRNVDQSLTRNVIEQQQRGVVGSALHNALTDATGAARGTYNIAGSAANTINRTLLTAAELALPGVVGPGDNPTGWSFTNGGQGLNDANATITNAATAVANMANPWSQDNAFMMMSHNMAFYQSLAARYGWGYALSYAAPSFLAAAMSDGTLSAGAAADTQEVLAIRRLANKAKTEGLSVEERLKYQQLKLRQHLLSVEERRKQRLIAEGKNPLISDARAERLKNLSVVKKSVANAAERITSPIQPIMAVARAAGRPMTDVKMNLAYLTTQFAIENDPELKKIWEETRDGSVYDANGKRLGTSGQMLAAYFGLDQGNMFFSPVSGLTDFYTKFLGADPFAATGKLIGRARSYYGFAGRLGDWFGGLGARGADDVYRAARQYRRVRKAFEYMATHSAAEIADTFRNTYSDYNVATKAGKMRQSDIITQLGEAKTVDEVMKIHADVAEGIGFVRNQIPSLSAYEVTKAALKGQLGEWFQNVGNLLGADGRFIESAEIQKMLESDSPFPVRLDDKLLYASNNTKLRSMAIFGRWIATRLERSAGYYDQLAKKFESAVIRPGSSDAIPAIMSVMRSALMPENVVRTVGDMLLRSKDPQEYINAYRNAMYHVVMRRATAGLSKSEFATFLSAASETTWYEVNKLIGIDGGGVKGVYIAGPHGEGLSRVVGPDGIGKYAGIGMYHLGELRLPRASDLRGLANEMRKIAVDVAGTSVGESANLSRLSLKEFASVADINKPNLETIKTMLKDTNYTLKLNSMGDWNLKEYFIEFNDIARDIRETIDRVQADDRILAENKFATVWDIIRMNYDAFTHEGKMTMLRDYIAARESMFAPGGFETNYKLADELSKLVMPWYGVRGDTDLADLLRKVEIKRDILRAIKTEMTFGVDNLARMLGESRKAQVDYEALVREAGFKSKQERELFKEELDKKWEKARSSLIRTSPYTPKFQVGVDFLNNALSAFFVPLALFSGGWALRVSASEALLNTLRNGFWPTFDARVAKSIAKHEINYRTLYGRLASKELVKKEDNLIKGTVAGALNSLAHPGGLIGQFVSGARLGFERNLIKSMDPERRERMIDDFVGTIMRHNGHLPGGVHDTNTVFDSGIFDSAAQNMVANTAPDGGVVWQQGHRAPGSDFTTFSPNDRGYLTALAENTRSIINDPILGPVSRRLAQLVFEEGKMRVGGDASLAAGEFDKMEEVLSAGAAGIQRDWTHGLTFVDKARKEMEKTALSIIQNLPPGEKERFFRSELGRIDPRLGFFRRDTAEEEWAAAIAEHVMASMTNGVYELGSVGARRPMLTVFHPILLASTLGEMPELDRLAGAVSRWKKAGTAPQHIPSRELAGSSWRDAASGNFIKAVTDKGHDKVLGPIVNAVVREPLYLLEVHNIMEELRPMIHSNIISVELAHQIADTRAMANMIKYVHNPREKTLFEVNMRVAAPFYFAKNQAWRRAFRVMHNDPGAFEKYMKMSLGVTNYISNATAGGTAPTVYLPGSSFMGTLAQIGATGKPGSLSGPWESLGFGLAADPGSIESVFPTGSEAGLAGLLGLARPPWGPLVTLPFKMYQEYIGHQRHPIYNKFMQAFLGPIASNTSIKNDFIPSTLGRNIVDVSAALAGAVGFGVNTNAIDSAENYVINNGLDNMYQNAYDHVMNQWKDSFKGINSWTGKKWTDNEIAAYCRAQAEQVVDNRLQNPDFRQKFLDEARSGAILMVIVKSAISMGSPVAVTLQQTFSQDTYFRELLSKKNPETGKKYTFEEASRYFAEHKPTHIMDLVAHSASPYTSYPETVQAAQILSDHPKLVQEFPYASAYLMERGGTYSPEAYQLEMSLDLRQREAPAEYLNSLLIAGGNDHYYNYLATSPEYGGDGDSQGKSVTYEQYKALSDAAKKYGYHQNPVWYSYFAGGKKKFVEIRAFNDMQKLLSSDMVPESMLPASERSKFNDIIQQYNETVRRVDELHAGGYRSDASTIATSWYEWCTKEATDPYWAKQSYFMLGVLRGLPTKNW